MPGDRGHGAQPALVMQCLPLGECPLLFDLEEDPKLEDNIAGQHRDICDGVRNLAIADAGSGVPEYIRTATDRPKCSPLLGY